MAKQFKYRLEPLLKIRAEKVRREREELARIVKKRMDAEENIARFQTYFEGLLVAGAPQVKASELAAAQNHKLFVKEEIKRLEFEKANIVEIENVGRKRLTEAMKNEKILTKLKDKRKDAHYSEINREENATMEEIAIRNFARKDSP